MKFCVCKTDNDTTILFDLELANYVGGSEDIVANVEGNESPVTTFESDSKLAFATV